MCVELLMEGFSSVPLFPGNRNWTSLMASLKTSPIMEVFKNKGLERKRPAQTEEDDGKHMDGREAEIET